MALTDRTRTVPARRRSYSGPIDSSTMMIWAALIIYLISETSACPNDCSFKGTCNVYNQCECFEGFTDADCSRRTCPKGPAWAAPATATDEGHQIVECSNAGLCDRRQGTCACFDGFVGNSCQRLACPAYIDGTGIVRFFFYLS